MAGVTGLEPAASGVTGQRSNRLSYTPTLYSGRISETDRSFNAGLVGCQAIMEVENNCDLALG